MSSEFERGVRGDPMPPDITDPSAVAEYQRGNAYGEAMAERHTRNRQRVRDKTREDYSQGYLHALKALSIQTVFWTGAIALVAALIRWRLHGNTRDVEETAAGAGLFVLIFCLLFIVLTMTAYTVARFGKVIVLVGVLGAAMFFGGHAIGAW